MSIFDIRRQRNDYCVNFDINNYSIVEDKCIEFHNVDKSTYDLNNQLNVLLIYLGEWTSAAGSLNVLCGLYHYLKGKSDNYELFVLKNKDTIVVSREICDDILNLPGDAPFGHFKIDVAMVEIILNFVEKFDIGGLCLIGGPNEIGIAHSLFRTNESLIITYVLQSPNCVVYYPKYIPVTLGFDTNRICLTDLLSNIAMDGLSSGKPLDYSIIRCGSSTLSLEIACHVLPPLLLLAEEINGSSIFDICDNVLSPLILDRLSKNIRHGVILISNGFWENISEVLKVKKGERIDPKFLRLLSKFERVDLRSIDTVDQFLPSTPPEVILKQLIYENFISKKIDIRLAIHSQFIGREGRCQLPSGFDSRYGWSLGQAAGSCLSFGLSNYVSTVKLGSDYFNWTLSGVPIDNLLENGVFRRVCLNVHQHKLLSIYREKIAPLVKDLKYTRQSGPNQFAVPRNLLNKSTNPLLSSWSLIAAMRNDDDILCDVENMIQRAIQSQDFRSETLYTWLQSERLKFQPILPTALKKGKMNLIPTFRRQSDIHLLEKVLPYTAHLNVIEIVEGGSDNGYYSLSPIIAQMDPSGASPRAMTPHLDNTSRIGICFLGRQSPGSHNIILGILESMKSAETNCRLYGFVNGALGLIEGHVIEITDELFHPYKNQSGIDLIGRSDLPFTSQDELEKCVETCNSLYLDTLVICGGIGSHADTALLAEIFIKTNSQTKLYGLPCSVENDMPMVEQSLGHDTACRQMMSALSSLGRDAESSRSIWYFVNISGRSLSHVIAACSMEVECACCVTSEFVVSGGMNLHDVVQYITHVITDRATSGKDFGLIIIAESFLYSCREIRQLISELEGSSDKIFPNKNTLTPMSYALFSDFPFTVQKQFVDKFVMSNTDVTIEASILLQQFVESELSRQRVYDHSNIHSEFKCANYSLSYQGQCSIPSNFDCCLGFTMGYAVPLLARENYCSLLITPTNLSNKPEDWGIRAIPLSAFVSVVKDGANALLTIDRRLFKWRANITPYSTTNFVAPTQFFLEPVNWVTLQILSTRSTDLLHHKTLCDKVQDLLRLGKLSHANKVIVYNIFSSLITQMKSLEYRDVDLHSSFEDMFAVWKSDKPEAAYRALETSHRVIRIKTDF